MPRIPELRTNFTAGELSKLVNARTDFGRYYNGSELVENFIILPQGPLVRRKGFKFISEVKDSSKEVNLLEFEFSDAISYVIELGNGYMRFFKDQGKVLDNAKTITGATQADPVVITATSHGYSNGNKVIIQNVAGMTELNGNEYTVANKTTNTFELSGVDGTGFTAYSSGGTSSRIHEITSPYSESEIFDVRYIQDSDVIYLFHPNHPIQKLIRTAVNVFEINEVTLLKGPFIDENIISTDVVALSGGSPWGEGDTGTLTASGGHTPFTSNHVGGLWKIKNGSDIAFLKITGFTSSTIVSVEFQADIPTSLRSGTHFKWSEGEFSAARSYPSFGVFHEQRMVLTGTTFNPQKLFFSQSNADYENFEAGTEDNDAFNVKIASLKGDPIRWLFSDDVLFIGTTNGIFRATNSSNGSVLTPSDIDVKRQISHGCSKVPPQLVGNSPVYFQKSGVKARGIGFSIQSDKYSAKDLNIDSDHVTGDGIKQSAYQQDPISNLWCVRNDGELALFTSEQEQEILAWARFKTQGNFESVAIVNTTQDTDEIYVVVNRTINGTTKRFIEVQDPNFLLTTEKRIFVDSYLTYNGTQTVELTLDSSDISAGSSIFIESDVGKEIHELGGNGRALITAYVDSENVTVDILEPFSSESILSWAFAIKTVTGLDHLEGSTVSIQSDNATVTDKVVTNGTITLPEAGAIIHVGLSNTSTQKSMPIELQGLAQAMGSTQGKLNRIDTVIIRVENTSGGKIIAGGEEIPIPARSTDNNMNETPPLFEGDIEVRVNGSWGSIGQITILQDGPQPMTIKSITYKTTANDK